MVVRSQDNEMDAKSFLQPLDESSLADLDKKIPRVSVSYENLSSRYLLWGRPDVTRQQYCSLYSARLETMRSKLEDILKTSFAGIPLKKLFEIEEGSETCAIIGTIFKKQELKPSILKEISEEQQLVPQAVLTKYTGEDDSLILEDELQRIQLTGDVDIQAMVTGVVCAAKGRVITAGKFHVEEVCFAGLPVPTAITPKTEVEEGELLLVSGLSLSDTSRGLLPTQLLTDYISGQLGCGSLQTQAASVVRVVIAGNSLYSDKAARKQDDKLSLLQDLDTILYQMASCCPVDVMPGEFDPANHVMPQQPLHKCLFAKSGCHATLQSCSNPYEARVGGRVIVGTSGQNVDDVRACSSLHDPLDIMQNLCQWGHVAPTAPDTLACYPFNKSDPFLMENCPDVMFAGNQDSFSCRTVDVNGRSVLVVSVPRFSQTGTCVVVNLRSLDCRPLVFEGYQQSPDTIDGAPQR